MSENDDEGLGVDGLAGGAIGGAGAGYLVYQRVGNKGIRSAIASDKRVHFTGAVDEVLNKAGNEKLLTQKVELSALRAGNGSAAAIKEAENDLIKGIKKSGGNGFIWKNMTGGGKAKVIVGTVAGIGIGVWAAHKMFRGESHADRIMREREAQSRSQGKFM
jgi:hypothetical protein